MKKSLLIVCCLLVFTASPVFAAAPVVLPPLYVAVSALVHFAVAGYDWFVGNKGGAATVNATTGNISKVMDVTWIDMTDPVPVVKTGQASARLNYNDFVALVKSDPTKYSILDKLIHAQPLGVVTSNTKPEDYIGKYMDTPSGSVLVTGVTRNLEAVGCQSTLPSDIYTPTSVTKYSFGAPTDGCTGAYGNSNVMRSDYSVTPYVPNTPLPKATVMASVNRDRQDYNTDAQINQIMQDAWEKLTPSVDNPAQKAVKIDTVATGGATNNAGTYPVPTPPTSAQITGATLGTALAQTSTVANNNLGTAQTRYSAASTALGSDPTNTEKQRALESAALDLRAAEQKVADAAVASAAAAAESDESKAQTANIPTNVYDNTDVVSPEKKDIKQLIINNSGTSGASGLFSSILSTLKIESTDTVCKVTCGTFYGKELAFDFCRYTVDLQKCGIFLQMLSHGFAMLIVFRGWRSE